METGKTLELQAQERSVTGKKVRHLRREGFVPAHIYGRGRSSMSVQVEAKALQNVLAKAGLNALVTLLLDSGRREVLIRGVARDNVTGAFLHADLQEVAPDETVRAIVPIVLTGTSPAAKGDALVIRVADQVNIEGLPAQLPATVHADVSKITSADQALHVRDLELPEGVKALDDPDEIVAKITVAPREVEVTPAEEEAAVEEEAAKRPAAAPEGEAPKE